MSHKFPQHIIESQQFSRATLEKLFMTTKRMKTRVGKKQKSKILEGKVMAALFYEPSTRTRFSFECAMHRLGGSVVTTENAHEFSSVTKGETLEDTIQILSGYVDVVVLRHDEVGAAERASAVSSVPIINAGDGAGQHPTQALLDLYTIYDELGAIDGKVICFVGDLLYGRTVHSLVYLLVKYRVKKLVFVAPKDVALHHEIVMYLEKKKIKYEETTNLKNAIEEADVVYQTRIQKERFHDPEKYKKSHGKYVINEKIMSYMKKKSIVMHPLPRCGEIAENVDKDSRAAYFRQAENGLYVRMALLSMILK